MKIPPSYTIIPEMIDLVAKIEANRAYLSMLKIPTEIKNNIQRISLLKSALYSARIEGNPLTMENIDISQDKIKIKEISNILNAVKIIKKANLTKSHILDLHKIVMKDLESVSGKFRREPTAIFNQAGIAIYMPPPPSQIEELIEEMMEYANSNDEKFPLISAFITHLVFEKIHPFIDGNGRVGRLLIAWVLKQKKYDFEFAVSFEQYLDEHKSDYYYYLDIGLRETNEYLFFMLSAFYEQTEILKKIAEDSLAKKEIPLLPPRQEEIYNIIRDHNAVSFDFISRRFLKVPKRTLRYDLKKLQEKKLILKIGETKGSFYKIVANRPD